MTILCGILFIMCCLCTFLRYERLCFLPVDVEGQGAELGCRSNNIREKEPPSARVRENKRTQNHYQDDPKTKQNKDHNKSNAPKVMLLLDTNKKGQYNTG